MRAVLLSMRIDGEYVFVTRSDHSTAKDGMEGTVPERVPNDVVPFIRTIREFDGVVPDAESD